MFGIFEYPLAGALFVLTFIFGYMFIGKVTGERRSVVRNVMVIFLLMDVLIALFILENIVLAGGGAGLAIGLIIGSMRV